MNFLAHAYLSFNDSDILAGNMISDYVKGKRQYDYSIKIWKGIRLHRAIDDFTDAHPAVKKAKQVFHDPYRLYAGAFVDIAFDHFLAIDKNEFPEESLEEFSQYVYNSLQKSMHALPPVFQQLFPYMKHHNWLYNYSMAAGIERSFRGLTHRAKYINDAGAAIEAFHRHYLFLKNCYHDFFPDLKAHATEWYAELLRGNDDVSYSIYKSS